MHKYKTSNNLTKVVLLKEQWLNLDGAWIIKPCVYCDMLLLPVVHRRIDPQNCDEDMCYGQTSLDSVERTINN